MTAEQTQQALNEHGERAQALRDELIFLIDRGDKVGEKLAVSPATPEEPSPPPPARGAPEATRTDPLARRHPRPIVKSGRAPAPKRTCCAL